MLIRWLFDGSQKFPAVVLEQQLPSAEMSAAAAATPTAIVRRYGQPAVDESATTARPFHPGRSLSRSRSRSQSPPSPSRGRPSPRSSSSSRSPDSRRPIRSLDALFSQFAGKFFLVLLNRSSDVITFMQIRPIRRIILAEVTLVFPACRRPLLRLLPGLGPTTNLTAPSFSIKLPIRPVIGCRSVLRRRRRLRPQRPPRQPTVPSNRSRGLRPTTATAITPTILTLTIRAILYP